MADQPKGGIGRPALLAILVATTAFWIAIYFLAVPALAKASGIAEQIVTLIVAAIALAFGIWAMLVGKSMAQQQAAGGKNG